MHKEVIHFKIGLSGTSKTKKPEFKICVNGDEFFHSSLTQEPNVPEFFEFEVEVPEGNQTLEISLLNKFSSDTKKDSNGNIVDDMLLTIDSIEIEEIDIGNLKWSASSYFPIYPSDYLDETQKQISEVKECVNMGWNGTWKLPFSTPFYMWLLENL